MVKLSQIESSECGYEKVINLILLEGRKTQQNDFQQPCLKLHIIAKGQYVK